jgi:hypothetical protein
MSIQPSLSKSRNAQPGPELSGRYFSGDFPLVWTHLIPLFSGGTSSKGNREGWAPKTGKRGTSNAPPATRDERKPRRVSCVPKVWPSFLIQLESNSWQTGLGCRYDCIWHHSGRLAGCPEVRLRWIANSRAASSLCPDRSKAVARAW